MNQRPGCSKKEIVLVCFLGLLEHSRAAGLIGLTPLPRRSLMIQDLAAITWPEKCRWSTFFGR